MRLSTKLQAGFVAVALPLSWAVAASARKAVHEVLLAKIDSAARSRAPEAERSLRLGLGAHGGRSLVPYVEGCRPGFGASLAAVYGPRGETLAASDPSAQPSPDAGLWRLAAQSRQPAAQERTVAGGPVLDFLIPVRSQDDRFLGALLLRFDLDDVLATEARIARRVFWFAGVAGILALALQWLLMRRMLAPVRELARGVERISRGDYGATVSVSSEDEIGELAGRFNEMSRELDRTTVSKDRFRAILDGMQDALFVTDAAGIVRTVNPALLALLGYAEDELLGKPAQTVFEPAAHEALAPELALLREGEPLRNRETRWRRHWGETVAMLLSASPLLGSDGKLAGVVFAARDMTELKRKDEEIRLKEAQLAQSEKLSLVGQLAAGIAHEINNPLGSILGFAQAAALRLQAADPLAEPLRCIEEEARRCRNLVKDLLAFSRQEPSRMEDLDLNEVVGSVLSMISAQARLQAVEILQELGLRERLRADRGQIQQVVVNLCSNALDAMPGGGRLTVRTRLSYYEERGHAVIEVCDTGAGIPPEIRARLFEPFFTSKEPGRGTGLGLALVQQIVRRHDGAVTASGAPEGGTVFTVSLPVSGVSFV